MWPVYRLLVGSYVASWKACFYPANQINLKAFKKLKRSDWLEKASVLKKAILFLHKCKQANSFLC